MKRMARSVLMLTVMTLALVMFSPQAMAAKKKVSVADKLAKRSVLETPQAREIRLNQEGKARVIITSDLEVDDMNSFIHQSLFFNEIELSGIVVSSSFCHFTGDGVHQQKDVMAHLINKLEGAPEMTQLRPQPLNWLENLWLNEYSDVYPYLIQNAQGYPTPEYLVSITKIGNVEFEGDTRFDTEGSDLIKACIMDEREDNLFILSWGGFNTVARALLSIYDDYSETPEWNEVYQHICDKVILLGNSQDYTFSDLIVDKYPDLVVMRGNAGYAGYSAALNAQEDARYTFQADWLKENIKFNHGSLMSSYKLVNDGQIIEGEEDENQFGLMNTVYNKTYNDFDFIAEGDSGHFISLLPNGLRTFENGAFGSYSGRITYTKANGEDAGYQTTLPGGIIPEYYVNPQTGKVSGYNPYLLDFQMEWAARADWCVGDYASCNHAPSVTLDKQDIEAAPGDTVTLTANWADPDGDSCVLRWAIDPTGGIYKGTEPEVVFAWKAEGETVSFTVPQEAQSGDCFCLLLRITDEADAPMTRYAQAMICVK